MADKRTSRWDQPFRSHKSSESTPSKVQNVKSTPAAPSISSQRSLSYSPPPVATPTAPKAMLYAALTSKVPTPVRLGLSNPHEGRVTSDPSTTQLSSPMVAPWNEHQVGAQHVQSQQMQLYGEGQFDHAARQRPFHPTEICDNYGCNGLHNHNDCPLVKRCWGCRSPNHFWANCPMTCKNCGSARHIPKHCSDFLELDSQGMAHPRRPSNRQKPGEEVHLPVEEVFTCDNYACRDMHSHFDCPLPSICWGCRSTGHFWAGCREICGKCGAKRHVAEYCHEFELWRDGLSRPKRSPQDVITYAMKRQREQEIDREQGMEKSSSPMKKQWTASSETKADLSPPIKTDGENSSPPLRNQDQYGPKVSTLIGRHHSRTHRNSDSNRPSDLPRTKRGSSTLTPSQDDSQSGRRTITDTRTRDREYCAFWLRMGRCNYEHTPLGCKYKHEVPDERTLRTMGIQFVPNWLKEKEKPLPTSWVYRAPVSINEPLQLGQQSSSKQEPADVRPPNGPRLRALPAPFKTVPKPLIESPKRYDRVASLTPASRFDHRTSTSPKIQPFMSETMKAFEEEEYFKQKRHEAEMKRKADEQRLEYEHELRMAKIRRK